VILLRLQKILQLSSPAYKTQTIMKAGPHPFAKRLFVAVSIILKYSNNDP
jgi:hypothetical protein